MHWPPSGTVDCEEKEVGENLHHDTNEEVQIYVTSQLSQV